MQLSSGVVENRFRPNSLGIPSFFSLPYERKYSKHFLKRSFCIVQVLEVDIVRISQARKWSFCRE